MAIVGIDLGTTNSLVATVVEGKVVPIPNALGDHLTPSVVSIEANGTILVGKSARERLVSHPRHTVSLFKRAMGTAQEFHLGKKSFRAEDLSALVLKSLKADAEAFLGHKVTEAVVSVPAYFNELQRQATKAAAKIAGLHVERLINEPTAAAVAYGVGRIDQEGTFLVLDLGGGTFDVSILELFDRTLEVHASAGDIHLGGEDFRWRLAEACLREACVEWGSLDKIQQALLMDAAEVAKNLLSEQDATLMEVRLGARDVAWPITRAQFEGICEDLLERMRIPVQRALRDSKVDPSSIDQVLMVGGATRMPMVRELAQKLLETPIRVDLDPDRVVAVGAGIQAALKSSEQAFEDVILTDVCPWTLGIAVNDLSSPGRDMFSPIIERNSTVPLSRSGVYVPVQEAQTTVDLRIYQGENLRVESNVLLGRLSIPVIKGKPTIENEFEVRFTYDINGILEVLVTHKASRTIHRLLLERNPGSLTPDQIEARMRELEALKVHPRDQEEIRLVLARAERLYSSRLGEEREAIGREIQRFEAVLHRQDPSECREAAGRMLGFLAGFEEG